MIDAARRYRELFEQLLFERTLAGGRLPQTREAELAAEVDRCWLHMTGEEQDEAEQRLANDATPDTPPSAELFDVVVNRGERAAPRKAAA